MTHLVPVDEDWGLWPTAALRGAGMPIDWLDTLRDGDRVQELRALLAEPRFRAALTWQNPSAMRNWAGAEPPAINAYRAGVLARYAQRYCAKNDSIGFFGPMGWARLTDRPGAELAVTGGGGIRWSDVYIEHWAAHALAEAWQADPRVQPYLPVHRNPSVWCGGEAAHRPYRGAVTLDDAQRAVLARVDGVRPAAELGEVGVVAGLQAAGVLSVGMRIPAGAHPLQSLRAAVQVLPPAAPRAELLADLDALESARREVAEVADRPAPLAAALDRLDREFVRVARVPPERSKQDADAGRTVAYLDCRRDLDVDVPTGLLGRLAAPLGLLLRSARWFTAQVADAADAHFARAFSALSRRGEVSLADLQFACADLLTGAPGTAVHEISADFALRWTEALGPDPQPPGGAGRLLRSRELEPLVSALFAAEAPGWAAARQHSPDVLLARTPAGPAWVLGELHMAMNTFESRFFHTLCDDPQQLVDLTATDFRGGRLVPCYPHGPQIDSRRYPPLAAHVPGRYRYWSPGDDAGAPDGEPSWPAAGLVVREDAGELVAGPPGGWALPVREFFGEFLSALVVNRFELPGPGPRITIDDVVVRRATWHFTPDQLPAAVLGRGRRGYRPDVLADWLAEQGVVGQVFARVPGEAKPFYVDLAAPQLVANLARAWRRAASGLIRVQEMLPAAGDLWLRDEQGNRYTTEFRMVAVDRVGRELPGLSAGDADAAAAGARELAFVSAPSAT
jgi:Lantibiotic dehydratase, N terminus